VSRDIIIPLEGYTVAEFEWEVKFFPCAAPVALNGNVQEVITQLVQINPDFLNDMNLDKVEVEPRISQLEERAVLVESHFCGGRWTYTRRNMIEGGIKYLRGPSGKPVNTRGGGTCARVSCPYGSAIWWCNDVSDT